ncbi:MAG: DNA translocase FtsK [Candidatus Margulisiibacteriota bacterium]
MARKPVVETQSRNGIKALALILGAVFIFLHTQFPASTGLLGHWIFDIVGSHILGQGLLYLPIFLVFQATAYLFGKHHPRLAWFGNGLGLLGLLLLLEQGVNGVPTQLGWPTSLEGGGVIGLATLWASYRLIGKSGSLLVMGGALVGGAGLIYRFCLKPALSWWMGLLPHDEALKPRSNAWLQKLIHTLFYTQEKPKPAVTRPLSDKTLPFISETKASVPLPLPVENDEEEDEEPAPIPVSKPPKPELKPMPRPEFHSDGPYEFPPLDLLEEAVHGSPQTKLKASKQQERAKILEDALESFNVQAKVVNITPGPSVTRYELQPGAGVKISKITSLSKDIALKLAVTDVRIEAPIPGKALIGIEVPNPTVDTVTLRTIIDKTDFMSRSSKLIAAMGLTITGESILMDLAKMPHILIAGATGSGKSVCVNTIILSILLRATPDEVRFLMIDPKKVELSFYNGIPHLLAPVVTDPHKAAATLKQWALLEMERRYEDFSRLGVKNIEGYNEKMTGYKKEGLQNIPGTDAPAKPIPYIVVIIDELADLMMVASQEVETTICRLAQMSRATGIHLVIATQRPSVNVITGLIKANVPSRISFFLQSQIDSRTILDMPGAEKLLGKGDMLYSPVGAFKPQRVQGIYVSEKEIKRVVDFLKLQGQPDYITEIIDVQPLVEETKSGNSSGSSDQDELFEEAKNIVMSTQYASTSYLQRKLRIGYNRAARLMDELEKQGIVPQSTGERRGRGLGGE